MNVESDAVPVFAWVTGERTNIGDSVLRRPYLAAVRAIGPVDVWIRSSTPDFLSGLKVGDARLTRAFVPWYLRLLRTALRRRTVLVLNAGESRVSASRAVLIMALLVACFAVRLRGGASVWLGAGVPRSSKGLLSLPFRWAGTTIDYLQWREPGSVEHVARRSLGPDWAFLEGSSPAQWTGDRASLSIVLRGDRPPPSDEWFSWIAQVCGSLNLNPVVVVQVRQDAERAIAVAGRLSAQMVEWPAGLDHATQEQIVRSVYARSLIVVGDRLHGLVMGATEGAVPLGWVESSNGKVSAHFHSAGMDYVGQFEGCPASAFPPVESLDFARCASDLAHSIGATRTTLGALVSDLAALRDQPRPEGLARLR